MQEGKSSKWLSGPEKGWGQLVAGCSPQGQAGSRHVVSLLTMPGWWLGTASARQVVLWNFACAPERMALTFLLPSGSHQSLTAPNVPLLSSRRGAPRGPWSREEAVTTLPDAPKATCHSHPVTHHPVCVCPPSQPPGTLGQTLCKP